MLIIKDLVIDFRDPVLWFIKSLILLYIVFYIMTLFISKSRFFSLLILFGGTICVCVVSYLTNGSFGLKSISGIPLFSVGVITALWSSKKFQWFHPAFPALLSFFFVISVYMSFYPGFIPNLVHVVADYATIALILLVCIKWSPTFKIPTILSLITFDIYLVHFKVLMVMKGYEYSMSILLFIIATALFSFLLYFLRTKLTKLVC